MRPDFVWRRRTLHGRSAHRTPAHAPHHGCAHDEGQHDRADHPNQHADPEAGFHGSHRRCSHLLAGLGALAADLRALLHQPVAVRNALAVVGALVADRGALAAQIGGMVGGAGHEPGRHAADLLAVLEQTLVLRRSVVAAETKAVMSGPGAYAGALAAVSHTVKHFA